MTLDFESCTEEQFKFLKEKANIPTNWDEVKKNDIIRIDGIVYKVVFKGVRKAGLHKLFYLKAAFEGTDKMIEIDDNNRTYLNEWRLKEMPPFLPRSEQPCIEGIF